MKKKKGMIAAVLVLILLIVVYLVLRNMNLEEEQTTAETETVFKVDSDDISELTIESGENEYTFKQEDETWTYAGDENFPLNTEELSSKVASITSVTATTTIEEPENIQEYGLDEPSVKITVKTVDGESDTLEVGDENTAVSGCYIMINEDESKIYLVDSLVKTSMEFQISDLALEEEIPSITGSTVKHVTVQQSTGTKELGEDGNSETGWTYTETDGSTSAAGSSLVQDYMGQFTSLSWNSFVSADTSDLSQYGLDNPAKVTISYEVTETADSSEDGSTEEDSEESTDSDNTGDSEDSDEQETKTVEKQAVLLIGNQDDEGNYYAKMQDNQYVYTLSSSTVEGIINITRDNFLDTKVSDYSFADMDKVTFIRNGSTYTATKVTKEVESDDEEGETTSETSYLINGKEVDMTEFSEFYSKITALEWQSQAGSIEPQGEPEITITFEKTGGIQVTTEYYSYDSNFYLVFDSKGNKVLVNKIKVKEILDSFDALIAGMSEK